MFKTEANDGVWSPVAIFPLFFGKECESINSSSFIFVVLNLQMACASYVATLAHEGCPAKEVSMHDHLEESWRALSGRFTA
jgi:hypothetical protein